MALLNDDAVVLRRLDYSETSQIVVMLARTHGKIRLIAKGIKRSTKTRFATAIDLLELGHVVWSSRPDRQRSLSPLTEWKQFNAFVGLRSSLSRLYAAQYAAEITSELTADEDPHPKLFDALVEYLKAVTLSDEPLVPLCAYLRVVLIEIGLMLRGDAPRDERHLGGAHDQGGQSNRTYRACSHPSAPNSWSRASSR